MTLGVSVRDLSFTAVPSEMLTDVPNRNIEARELQGNGFTENHHIALTKSKKEDQIYWLLISNCVRPSPAVAE